jgi:hypothetical protein
MGFLSRQIQKGGRTADLRRSLATAFVRARRVRMPARVSLRYVCEGHGMTSRDARRRERDRRRSARPRALRKCRNGWAGACLAVAVAALPAPRSSPPPRLGPFISRLPRCGDGQAARV